MEIVARFKRVAREILGRKQPPGRHVPEPSTSEEQLYAAIVERGDACFDVGANTGEVSLFLARLAGESGMVVAFEPAWPTYVRLCQHLQSDTTLKAPIVTVPAGLADSDEHATIQVPDGDFGIGSMADAVAWGRAQAGSTLRSYPIRLTTLDSFLSATGLRPPEFLKVDVEGAELFVLRGASGLFSGGHRPIMLIEVFAPWEEAFGYRPWEPLSWLMELGYRFLFACPDGLVEHLPTADRPFPPEYEMGYNVVAYVPAVHGERVDRLRHLRAGFLTRRLPMAPPPRPNRLA